MYVYICTCIHIYVTGASPAESVLPPNTLASERLLTTNNTCISEKTLIYVYIYIYIYVYTYTYIYIYVNIIYIERERYSIMRLHGEALPARDELTGNRVGLS